MQAKLHHLKKESLCGQRVSNRSFWNDDQWKFDNHTAGQRDDRSTINWAVRLHDGSRLADPKWESLLDSFRRLIWSLFTASTAGIRYKPGMASYFGKQVAYLARWMVENDYRAFAELDATAFEEYVEHLCLDKIVGRVNPPTATYLLHFLTLPRLLWEQASELRLAGVEPAAGEPYGGASPFSKAKELAADARGQIPPMEDDVFIKVMTSAMAVLDVVDEIIGAIEAYMKIAGGIAALGECKREARLRRYLGTVSRKFPGALPYFQGEAAWLIWSAMATVRDACSVMIQGGVGLRTSEYCGLVVDPTRSGFPACISVRRSVSGLDEIFFIKGRVYKGRHDWTEHEWVAGSRPVGTSHLPPPIKAVLALVRLYRCFRTDANKRRLALYAQRAQTYITPATTFVPAISDQVRRAQKAFAREHAGITDWNIAPSQWRKSFAQFVVRTDSRMPPALRTHFLHVNLAVTEVGYARVDPEYRQVLDDAAVQNSIAFLGSLVSERKSTSGTMAETVRQSGERLGVRLGNRDDAERRSDIEDIVIETGVRVHELSFGGQPAGDCIYRPGSGRCTMGCVARWVMPTPLWSAARPDVCWECENLALSPDHAAFWRARWDRYDEVYKSATASGEAGLASLSRLRMAQCASVLSRFGIKAAEVKGE
ncbi:hypothetical protein ASG43_14080 [Aureimonas sp. Leaf454]|uniref:hypothetical protein n=1 Tax=Aureimonas sp. Leaf454 TaxID=1736381 RepID=UPI0006FC03F5|nr:hypothetical protein [Aureimonas sp. Leaf454]KQT44467.1 hypothetical protein ASG43_14080 [Aureimonas sp. Leaf454]